MNKPVVVLGSTGMLGSMVVSHLSKSMPVVATNRQNLNALTCSCKDLERVLDGAEWAVNCIGAIPQRNTDSQWMYPVNAVFPARLAVAAAKAGTHVIQIESDCVFDGKRGIYLECDKPNATDMYGRSKAMGEVQSEYMYHIRCSIVGPEYHGKSLLGWFLSQPKNAKVNGYANHFWNGVTTLAFAKVCQGVIEGKVELPLLHHLVPKDIVNKAQLLDMFREFYRPDIEVAYSHDQPEIDRTLQTENQKLNKSLWKAAGYEKVPTIRELIQEMATCG